MVSHDVRIARAELLAQRFPAADALLQFYGDLTRFQKTVFDDLKLRGETDLAALVHYFPQLIRTAAHKGTDVLAAFAEENLGNMSAQTELLTAAWQGEQELVPGARFYAKALLQPYAEYLASRGNFPAGDAGSRCPFCSALPVAGVLRGEGDGGKRWLLCSLCSGEWQYRRVLCPNCGEEDREKLPIYTTDEFPAARVDACDSCKTYLKSIDLTKDGHAIPVVDDIATIALNIWAEEHGYSKFETNLLGV